MKGAVNFPFNVWLFTSKRKKNLKTIIKKAILKFLSASDKLARFPPKWASSKFLLKIPNVLDQNEIIKK